MRNISVVMIAVVFMFIAGCQAGNMDITRTSSAATCTQDVLNAWNNNCASYNFSTGNMVDTVTVGSLYHGSDFSTDAEGLKLAMKNELLSTDGVAPFEIEDLLTAILQDSGWFE